MLNHFDTVFAFIAVMAGVSLMVTTLTQTVGALFGFRGRHLKWGLSSLIENYAPELRTHAEALSGHLLAHPLVSDSMFSQRGWTPANPITSAAHFIWRGWKYATAVRPEELRAIVANLSDNLQAAGSIIDEGMKVVKKAEGLKVSEKAKWVLESYPVLVREVRKLKDLPGVANYWSRVAEKLAAAAVVVDGKTVGADEARAELVEELESLFRSMAGVAVLEAKLKSPETSLAGPTERIRLVEPVQTTHPEPGSNSVVTVQGEVKPSPSAVAWDRWFDSTMDRVSQRFGSNMKIWTVAFSVLLAFGAGLDSLALYKKLSSDAELRARLILGTDALSARFETLNARATGSLAGATLPAEDVKELKEKVTQVQAMLAENERLGIFSGPGAWWSGLLAFFGCAASAILLSLGAPFWFNALKKMANLRPLLANKTEDGK